MKNVVLVTGATSRNGRALLASSRGVLPLRGAARDPQAIEDAGIERCRFDWRDPETYRDALDGVGQVFLIVPEEMADGPQWVERFAAQAVKSGVERFVVLSAMGVDQFPGHPLHLVEQTVAATGARSAVLRPNWFMQNFSSGLFTPNIVQESVIRAPAGDALVSFVDVQDIAAVGTAVLANPDLEESLYEVTGGEALSFATVADTIGQAAGRPIRYESLDLMDPDLTTRLGMPGADPRPVQALFSRVVQGLEAPVKDTVHKLTGRAPTTFAEFAQREAAAWSAGSATAGQPQAPAAGDGDR
jgi:uncharacterized protein YbjT (DUF2867 family)